MEDPASECFDLWVPHSHVSDGPRPQAPALLAPGGQKPSRLPSVHFRENTYTTLQDDWVAFETVDPMNRRRLAALHGIDASSLAGPRDA